MEETVENIVSTVLGKLSRYDNNAKNWILNEAGSRLIDAASNCLKEEYLKGGDENE